MKFLLLLLMLSLTFTGAQSQTASYGSTLKGLQEKYGHLSGMRVREVIKEMQLDTAQFYAVDEPPLILSSLHIALGDTMLLACAVDRTSIIGGQETPYREHYKFIENKKVKAVVVYDIRKKIYYTLK